MTTTLPSDLQRLPEYWPQLDAAQRARVLKLLTPRMTRYIPNQPTAKQAAFLLLDLLEVLYGGSAGGGKSEALLMASLQYADVPGYSALLLRKTYADLSLPGALMDRAHDWLGGTDARWYAQDKRWDFPSGASLSFGYLENERDKYRYQSAEFQFVGFDELTQFTETQYRYMFSRVRRGQAETVPLRIRAASNPGNIGHDWVKARFIQGGADDRAFVPAKLTDNPHLDQESYLTSLAQLDQVTRQRLEKGDWDVSDEGGLFKREWFGWLDASPPDSAFVKIIWFWDLAGTEESDQNPDPDYTAGLKVGRTRAGEYVVLDGVLARRSPQGVEKLVQSYALQSGVNVEQVIEQEPGSSGKSLIDHYRRNVLRAMKVTGRPSTGDKVTRARPVSALAEAGQIKLVRGAWNGMFLDMWCAFPQEGVHDDPVDALSGSVNYLEDVGKNRPIGVGVSKWL